METALVVLAVVAFAAGVYFVVYKTDKDKPTRPAGGRPKDPNIKKEVE